jgi:transcriptional regulator with XRE-family HTH domain
VDNWSAKLLTARQATRMSRAALSQYSGISSPTIKAYETGKRHPSRELLTVLLDTLKTERPLRDQILERAGFAPDGARLRPGPEGYMFTVDEALADIEERAWPVCVLTELMEVLGANALLQRVWNVDLSTEFMGPFERNLMTVVTTPRFADRIVNWDEVVTAGISAWKGHHRGPEELHSPSSAYFMAVMQKVLAGDPAYVQRLVGLWDTVPPVVPKVRWRFPVVWDRPPVGELRFEVVVNAANEHEGFYFQEWHPLGADAWTRLEQLASL